MHKLGLLLLGGVLMGSQLACNVMNAKNIPDPAANVAAKPGAGPQYRSAIFCANEDQKRMAEAYIAQLEQAKVFSKEIVTQVVPPRNSTRRKNTTRISSGETRGSPTWSSTPCRNWRSSRKNFPTP